MTLALKDRVQETGTANTTVSFTLTGTVTGFQAFSVIGNGNTTYYVATDSAGNWEVGVGTYSTTGPTLTRTTILSSSNSGSAVTFSGTVNVFVTYPAEQSVNLNADGVMEVGEPIGYADTGLVATFASTVAGYNQVVVQNLSNDTDASANINISNNVSTDTTGFAELGINSSTFVGTGSFSIPNGAYLASAGTDLTIGTYNANDIHFVTNSNTTDAMTIFDNGGISLGELANPGIGNIACNNINLKFQQILTTAGTTTLTNASPYYTQFTGTNVQDLVLPDATTCLEGTTFIFDNDSTQDVTIKDGAGTTFELLVPGGFHTFVLEDNSTIAGIWLRYSQVPSAVEWGTLSLSLGATVITGGVWNGGTIPTGYGGTGLTGFSAANNAIYSTGANTLTAGTLPVLAGGTGQTSYTDGQLLIGNTTGNTLTKATLTAGSGITITNGSGSITIDSTVSPMTYPGAGIAVSTGSAWGTSLTAPSGAIVGTTDTQTLTNKTLQAYGEKVETIGTIATSTYNIDLSLANIFDLTLGTNVTVTFTNPPASGTTRPITLIVRQPATSPGNTLTVTGAQYTDGTAPILSTGANQKDVLSYWSIDGGTTYFGTFAMANVS